MKRLFALLACTCVSLRAAPPPPLAPDELLGPLFAAVQRAHVFDDQKTFPDCVPKRDPAAILRDYEAARTQPGFDLRAFVAANFQPPPPPPASTVTGGDLRTHIAALWSLLLRTPQPPPRGSSLLPLPHPYVVPGGRFREVYYWDSYFTMLGLREAGRDDLIRSMLDNFAHELATYGLIPNGNRTYYLTRSQPPFFALMVELLAEREGDDAYRRYRAALEAEYAYWNDASRLTQHVVRLPDGLLLNRYWDRGERPRAESFAVDEAASRTANAPLPAFYRDIRSAAESGWDFSSRWFGDGHNLATIRTTQLAPVDLNALLWQLETTLAHSYALTGAGERAAAVRAAADRRADAIRRRFWSSRDGFFCDFDLDANAPSPALTLAGVVPLFLKLATAEQAHTAAQTLRARFLRAGGLVTSLVHSGQQWDAPNGWAPLEWMAIRGLAAYDERALAAEIAHRWVSLNRAVYQRTGRLMEKYNVEDTSLPGGGGEYPGQDGFGWTNGVLAALLAAYPESGNRDAPTDRNADTRVEHSSRHSLANR